MSYYNEIEERNYGVYDSNEQDSYRQTLLDTFYLRIKWERRAWTISSVYFFVVSGLFVILSALYFLLSPIIGSGSGTELGYVIALDAVIMLYCSVLYTVIGIIGMIVRSKITKYMDGLYDDCGPALKRGTSVGMIIFCFLFNNIALIFYLINFVYAESNKAGFEEIRYLQYKSLSSNNADTFNN